MILYFNVEAKDDLDSFETAFTKLDMNGDGLLSQNEVLDIIPQEDLKTLLYEMDGDGDGQIDYGVGPLIKE